MKSKLIFLSLISLTLNSYCAEIEQVSIEEYEKEFVVEGKIILTEEWSNQFYVILTTTGEQFRPAGGKWPFEVKEGLKGKFTLKKIHDIATCADSPSLPLKIINFEKIESGLFDNCSIL